MDPILSKIIPTALFLLFIFLSGFWLSRSGKPYKPFIFNIHKLIGLAAGIFLGVTVHQVNKAAPLEPAQIACVAVTISIFVVNVADGGLVSIDAEGGLKNASQALRTAIGRVHKLFPYLAALSTAITLYLLLFAV